MAKLDTLYFFTAHQLASAVLVYDGDGNRTRYSQRIDFTDLFLEDPEREAEMLAFADASQPVLVQVNENILYGVVKAGDRILLAGPALAVNGFELKHRMVWEEVPDSYSHLLVPCTLTKFAEMVLLLFDCFAEKEMTLQECFRCNSMMGESESALHMQLQKQVYTSRENDSRHNPYDHEQREMGCIENGDLQGLKIVWEEQYAGEYGKTSQNMARNGRNLAIIVVALAVRAAIRGGVVPELAMSAGDLYMQKIDVVPNVYELGNIVRSAEYELIEMVVEAKKHSGSGTGEGEDGLILRCKEIVFSGLHSRLTVREIAERLGVHQNYLSARFRQKTGLSLYQYILEEKISLAKSLLVYSDYSYSAIAATIGFTSQSHFGVRFREACGMTPQQFRQAYRAGERGRA